MRHGVLRYAAFLFALTLLACSLQGPLRAEEIDSAGTPPGEYMILDFLLARPAGITATAVGSVFFVLSLPFSAAAGNADEAAQALVADPARFTFTRPLGRMEK